ncbi:MAG: prolyl oligopeptidase family serine peptidase [Moorea sp. SIO2B7]|nr:prolyl oligopeptidase family serine peptidase [Moorena sp. SIO2B7]
MERKEFFESKGTKIYGTLTLPNREKKHPACLFVGGSFPQTRDGNIDNSKTDWFPKPVPERNLFRDEAKILEKIGIATFRYDKRGCGKSEGDFNTTTLFDLVDDARNALEWMGHIPEIDKEKIGVIGQSEGAVIALILAANNPHIIFYVWQGGIYNSLETILKWQEEAFWKSEPENINNFQENVPLMYWIYKQIDDINHRAKLGHKFFRIGDDEWSFDLFLSLFKEHFENPPSIFVEKVKCPVLILHGDLDHNTPPTEAELMQQALINAGNMNVTKHIFAGLDHSFRRLDNPDEDFVTSMRKSLDSVMPEVLTNWLKSLLLLT